MGRVSSETWGTSRLGWGTTGACGGRDPTDGGGSRVGGRAAGCRGAGTTGRMAVSPDGTTGRAAAWVAGLRPLILSIASLILSHPVVATANSAKSASVLRRMTSLHGLEDAGAVQAAQQCLVATLRVGHDPHHVARHAADSRDVVRRSVRVVPDVPPYHPSVGLELGRGARVRHVA